MKTLPDSRLLYKCPAREFFSPEVPETLKVSLGDCLSRAGLILSRNSAWERGMPERNTQHVLEKRYIDYLQTKYVKELSIHRPPKPYGLDTNN
jgi:hypothetical protein